jgi:hypothetical protein
MCHPVFSTKEFVQEFILRSSGDAYPEVQELQEFRSCRRKSLRRDESRTLVESIEFAPVFF